MLKDKAWKIANDVAEAGMSVQVTIGIHPDMAPSEHCSVHPVGLRFNMGQINKLSEIAEAHDCMLYVETDGLKFV
jgi:hypothetical protein